MDLSFAPELIPVGIIVTLVLWFMEQYLSKKRTIQKDIYVPAYNQIRRYVNSLPYDSDSGEFELLWDSLDPHIRRGIKEDNRGHFILLDGDLNQLNRFLTNYRLFLESKAEASEYIIYEDGAYFFDVGGEIGEIALEEFINRFGSTIIATSEKKDLWKRLQWGAPHNGYYSSINKWDVHEGRIDLLWEARQKTYLNNPNMVQDPQEVYHGAIERARKAEEFLNSKISHVD